MLNYENWKNMSCQLKNHFVHIGDKTDVDV